MDENIAMSSFHPNLNRNKISFVASDMSQIVHKDLVKYIYNLLTQIFRIYLIYSSWILYVLDLVIGLIDISNGSFGDAC